MIEFCNETEALEQAATACHQRGASLTAIRREVLALLYRTPKGIKAYDLLDQMRQTRSNASPPTVYRALDFLIEQGLAHRIGRMNLFVACRHGSHSSHGAPSLFLVCPRCNSVTELEDADVASSLYASLAATGHKLDSNEVEISAVCPQCLASETAATPANQPPSSTRNNDDVSSRP